MPRTLLPLKRLQLILSLALAAVIGIGIFVYSVNLEKKYALESEKTTALFLIRDIPKGTPLSDVLSLGYVQEKEILANTRPINSLGATFQQTEILYANKDLSDGQILLLSDFSSTTVAESGLAIPDGYVAVSLRLGDVERISPFLKPGNNIAIFVTGASKKSSGSVTRVLVPKAQVIGIGDVRYISGQESIISGDASLITLAVKPNEAALVIQATKSFVLQFALLGVKTDIASDQVTIRDVIE